MFARLAKWCLVAALVLTTGVQWAALQTVAWTTMLASNLRSDSLTQAVAKTFDGDHPCPLCKAIAAAKKSGNKAEILTPVIKLEFPPVPAVFVFLAPPPVSAFSRAEIFASPLSLQPPVPPPRGCFA